jgi:hypothetical protein
MQTISPGVSMAVCALTALLALSTLLFSIARLVRCLRSALEATIELRESMQVDLPTAGDKVLYVRAPRFSSIRGLTLSMRDAQGREVTLSRIVFPWTVSGSSDVRISYARLTLPAAGRYTLSAQEIPSGPLALIFSRPNMAQTVGWILAIVGSAGALIASIVLGAIMGSGLK